MAPVPAIPNASEAECAESSPSKIVMTHYVWRCHVFDLDQSMSCKAGNPIVFPFCEEIADPKKSNIQATPKRQYEKLTLGGARTLDEESEERRVPTEKPCGAQSRAGPSSAGESEVVPKDITWDEVPPTKEDAYKKLMEIQWKVSKDRRNVLPEGVEPIEAMCQGMSWDYTNKKAGLSLLSGKRPILNRFMASFSEDIGDLGFCFTGIQLNRNYSAAVHVDANNIGDSYIIGLGSYTGCKLWMQDPNGTVAMPVTKEMTEPSKRRNNAEGNTA